MTLREIFFHSPLVWAVSIYQTNPVTVSSREYSFSSRITGPLVRAICQQDGRLDYHTVVAQSEIKSQVRREKRAAQLEHAERLHSQLPQKLQRLIDLAREKGSSNWLIALPIESHGFLLHKGAFQDAISLRYGWQPSLLPATCACGRSFTVDHALNCPTGGFPTLRHNEIWDFTANLISEVCHDVCVEHPFLVNT